MVAWAKCTSPTIPSWTGMWPSKCCPMPSGRILRDWHGSAAKQKLLPAVSGGSMMAVEVSTRGVFRPGIAKALFSASTVGVENLAVNYDVSADGQRFVIVQQVDAGETPTITVVENWYSEFKDKQ